MKNSRFLGNKVIFLFDVLGAVILYMLSVIFVLGLKMATIKVARYSGIAVGTIIALYGAFHIFGIYKVLWNLAGTKDYVRLCSSCILGSAIAMLVVVVLRYFFPHVYIGDIRYSLKIAFLMA